MATTTIGQISVSADDNGLDLRRGEHCVHVDPDGAHELLDFLRSVSVNEANKRRAFRIPLVPESGLAVNLHSDSHSFPATPRDISLNGIFVELTDTSPSLNVDQTVDVQLEYGGERLSVAASVRRVEAAGYGLEFTAPESDKPPAALSAMIMELQREWLRRRTQTSLSL